MHTKAPGNHNRAKPLGWARPLHHDVGRYLGRHIPREEDGECDVVVQALQSEVGLQPGQTSVADI